MSFVAILFFLVALCVLASLTKRGSDILSPARMVIFVWSFALGLAELKLSNLQHEWSTESWLLVLIGPSSLLLGLYTAFVMNVYARLVSPDGIREVVRRQIVDSSLLFWLIIISFVVYAASFLVSYAIKGFVPIFSGEYGGARTKFSVFGLGVLVHSMPVIVFFGLVYHVMVKEHVKQKLLIKIVCLISAVTYLFLLQRFLFILTAVMCFSFAYYATDRMRCRTILVSFITAVGLFFGVSSLRAGEVIQAYLYAKSKMKYSMDYAIFTEPYMYVVMNLENLATGVKRLDHFTFGYYTFDFITALAGVKHWMEEYFSLESTPYLNSSYNTYTAFWTYYRDFGIFGIVIVPLLIGLVVGSAYYAMRREPTLQRIAAYGIMVFILLFTFFNSPVGFLVFVYVVVAVYLILRLVTRVQTGVPVKWTNGL